MSRKTAVQDQSIEYKPLLPRPGLFYALLIGWLVWLALLWAMWLWTR